MVVKVLVASIGLADELESRSDVSELYNLSAALHECLALSTCHYYIGPSESQVYRRVKVQT